jgi:glycosyltransferase involved in cell wall biosynthesis
MDWDDYGQVDLAVKREYYHFLGKAAWKKKNLKGAIQIISRSKGEHLKVLGGWRLNLKMGPRFTVSPKVSFAGMVGGEKKNALLQRSKGLIFPVRWNEPFGLAIIESLYFGCPVFGTPYGSLPELVTGEFGFLSNRSSEIVEALKSTESYSRQKCHEYARDVFNSRKMAESYLEIYNKVLNGEKLNKNKPVYLEDPEILPLPWHS